MNTETTTATTTDEVKYAGFWRRFVAFIIDSIILAAAIMLPEYAIIKLITDVSIFKPPSIPMSLSLGAINSVLYAVVVAIFLKNKWQATPGKRLMKCYVVKLENGNFIKPDFKTGFLRYFTYAAFILLINWIVIGIYYDEYQQLLDFHKNGGATPTPEQLQTSVAVSLSNYLAILWFIPIVFSRQKKAAHDFIVNTRVLKGRI